MRLDQAITCAAPPKRALYVCEVMALCMKAGGASSVFYKRGRGTGRDNKSNELPGNYSLGSLAGIRGFGS